MSSSTAAVAKDGERSTSRDASESTSSTPIPRPAASGPRLATSGRRVSRGDAKDAGRERATSAWLRLDEAARVLGVNDVTLRRAIDRHARRDSDGRVFSEFDGVRARKLGRQWRVLLDPCWCADRA